MEANGLHQRMHKIDFGQKQILSQRIGGFFFFLIVKNETKKEKKKTQTFVHEKCS